VYLRGKTMELREDPRSAALVYAFEISRREDLRRQLAEQTFERNGALLWKCNSAVIPVDTFREAGYFPPAAQAEEREKDIEAFMAEYCKRKPTAEALAEQAFEIEANFAPEETIVNVLTGKVVRKGRRK
jgi:hypothetical protein